MTQLHRYLPGTLVLRYLLLVTVSGMLTLKPLFQRLVRETAPDLKKDLEFQLEALLVPQKAAKTYFAGLFGIPATLRQWPTQRKGQLECGQELVALPQEECESVLLASCTNEYFVVFVAAIYVPCQPV